MHNAQPSANLHLFPVIHNPARMLPCLFIIVDAYQQQVPPVILQAVAVPAVPDLRDRASSTLVPLQLYDKRRAAFRPLSAFSVSIYGFHPCSYTPLASASVCVKQAKRSESLYSDAT